MKTSLTVLNRTRNGRDLSARRKTQSFQRNTSKEFATPASSRVSDKSFKGGRPAEKNQVHKRQVYREIPAEGRSEIAQWPLRGE